MHDEPRYEAPVVEDAGTLVDLTQALSINGDEDGMSKAVPMHHQPPASAPASP